MDFFTAARVADIPSGTTLGVQHGENAVLIANVEGTFYAIAGACTHRGGILSQGTVENGIVTCPRHGSQFDVRTGESVAGPKILFVRAKTKAARTYPVKVEGDDVLVGIE